MSGLVSIWMSFSKVHASFIIPKRAWKWASKIEKNSMLVDRASDGLIFMDIDVVECFDYDLVL